MTMPSVEMFKEFYFEQFVKGVITEYEYVMACLELAC